MRFLVTGGAGFIGANLANKLYEQGHDVLVLDDLSNGDKANLHPGVAFTQGDVNDVPLLWSLLPGVDCVYHLAARVSVAQSLLHPGDYNRVNVGGTVSLMEAMRDTGVKRVVFASSGAVYGRYATQPVHEKMLPQPDSPYAVSKWSAEQYIHTIGALWHIETVALRIFNAYGPGQSLPVSHAPVVPRFVQQALTGGSIVIFGDGSQTRDFVFVDDVVTALETAATADNINRKVINIGSGQETSINQLAEMIAHVTGHPVNIIHNREKSGGAPRLVADIRQAKILLGIESVTSLEVGLRLLLEKDGRFLTNPKIAAIG
ncbi:MAG: NAD-dependent epimerase/dehydratase family protein [Candidatus Thermofonsia bacterium]|nr:MAG: NAD-dependent epimerase/dehydratase family protein [Candidatus Thermofonsia bacterium]